MRVLVVDPNAGFAALVAGELERLGYKVAICAEGYDAYQSARADVPDLALLDAGLQEPDAQALARSLRLLNREMRLMLIAATGEEEIWRDVSIPIQGVLPRPFFLPELPERIEAAMRAPLEGTGRGDVGGVSQAGDAPAGSTTQDSGAEVYEPDAKDQHGPGAVPDESGLSRRAFRLHQGAIESLMVELAKDVGAAGAILTCAAGLLTAVGSLDEAEIDAVSRAVLQGRQTSAEVARILGREQVRFEQSTAGDSHMLYALGVHNATLALMVKGETQLGLLRHRARATGERIAALCVLGS